ncbi:SDR family oxidoreductase [Virgibacillus halodenitrificans]|uniref:Oxidoreductase n=1 Tax=Virgibacillus halodenitrificans TaxID=1482 RepID=A0AAC9J2H1_VIRHA|nr:SDR family oxidoreductase [Virgibacillus halodenitrificans]APC49474.1 oxidoreductase [Virgibacillus halodenitrificans]MCJ0929876.1 SDR family oxidoreductase [Virgibacillus halodenitrificans]
MNRLGQVAVITGVSHSKGIGAAVCLEFAKAGYDVFFTCWDAEEKWLKIFKKEIQDYGVVCNYIEADFRQQDSYTRVLNGVEATLGVPVILINNAAHSVVDGYKNLDVNMLDEHYAVNMRALMMLSVEFAKRFEASPFTAGRIINITSGQNLGPMVDELAYGATKGAISAFTSSLSAELAPLGITVNAVNPGPTDTGWMTNEIKKELLPKFKMGRIGMPKDAARLIAFLVSEEAEWITGQILHSEGGFLRS